MPVQRYAEPLSRPNFQGNCPRMSHENGDIEDNTLSNPMQNYIFMGISRCFSPQLALVVVEIRRHWRQRFWPTAAKVRYFHVLSTILKATCTDLHTKSVTSVQPVASNSMRNYTNLELAPNFSDQLAAVAVTKDGITTGGPDYRMAWLTEQHNARPMD